MLETCRIREHQIILSLHTAPAQDYIGSRLCMEVDGKPATRPWIDAMNRQRPSAVCDFTHDLISALGSPIIVSTKLTICIHVHISTVHC